MLAAHSDYMELLIAVLVAGIGGPLVVLIKRFDRRNTEQHDANSGVLQSIATKVDLIDEKITHHIDWHLSRHEENDA